MELLYLTLMTGLLLFVQTFHLASLQYATGSPGNTIDKSWWRGQPQDPAAQDSFAEEEVQYDQGTGENNVESSTDYSSGIVLGSKLIENNTMLSLDNKTSDGLNGFLGGKSSRFPNVTENQTDQAKADSRNIQSNQNKTEDIEQTINSTEFVNTSSHQIHQNSSGLPDVSNRTDFETNLTPEGNKTQEDTNKPDEDEKTTNNTDSPNITWKTTEAPEIDKETNMAQSTFTIPEDVAPATPETNITDESAALGSSSERGGDGSPGSASDSKGTKTPGIWAALLGTALAVACVGLLAYVILKKNNNKSFSHRKLVDDFPPGPVLRLDNSDPMDLNFGGSAYYNPSIQGDNIQMKNIPE